MTQKHSNIAVSVGKYEGMQFLVPIILNPLGHNIRFKTLLGCIFVTDAIYIIAKQT